MTVGGRSIKTLYRLEMATPPTLPFYLSTRDLQLARILKCLKSEMGRSEIFSVTAQIMAKEP